MVNVDFFGVGRDPVYSQAVRIGERVEIAGQGGWDANSNFPEKIEDEIDQAFKNITDVLKQAGTSWSDVVSVNSYHVGLAGHQDEMNKIMGQNFQKYMPDHKPIWTNNGVTALGDPKMRVEIRVVAVDQEK